ncbi:MAG: rRNA maturation RNase YbeY [Phycisphaerae bacterium]|nr:rRNA maturation RNase YbeY [Phycisphaerae bacterium]
MTPTPAAGAPVTVRMVCRVAGLSRSRIKGAVRAAAGDQPIRAIGVAVVDDAMIALLHGRYLADPRATDVMSFDLRDDPRDGELEGEIVISAETAARQARALGLRMDQEVLRYVVHGVLHLLGHDDKTASQRRRMRRQENAVLSRLADRPEPACRLPPRERRV